MTDTNTQELLDCEEPKWQKLFLNNWNEAKKDNPNLTFVESIKTDIHLRTLLRHWIQINYPN